MGFQSPRAAHKGNILSNERLDQMFANAYLELEEGNIVLPTDNKLDAVSTLNTDNPVKELLAIMRNPDYFGFTCKKLFNIDLLPFQLAILKELWVRPYVVFIASRGAGKSFLGAVYCMLRLLFHQGCKIVIIGSGFRQSRILFEYCETIWMGAPILRSMVGASGKNDRNNGPRRDVDRVEMVVGDSLLTGLPVGDGKKIRGLRANYLWSDEHQAGNKAVFDNVISGFAVVSSNPVEAVKQAAKMDYMKSIGIDVDTGEVENAGYARNQLILSGTADYYFNHFYEEYCKYKAIIESRGDKSVLEEIFKGEVPQKFNWRDYGVIQIPVELLPRRFMDEAYLAKSKATMHGGNYLMEFGARFSRDSAGFFKRSLIESCVTNNSIQLPSGPVRFPAAINGFPDCKYVYAIDPASEHDNFAIVILEVYPDHRRVVYCWTMVRSQHKELVRRGTISETNFFAYCGRKIRELMKTFPCERIIMDSQGGGYNMLEVFHDMDKLGEDGLPIYEIIDEEKPKDTDDLPGLHLLELATFRDNTWLRDANHGLKKDLLDKTLLFPYFDALGIEIAAAEDARNKKEIDTLEDCIFEIEDLKNELASIKHSLSPTGLERWDANEIELPNGKKGRARKDRYTALMMANMAARQLFKPKLIPTYQNVGGGWARSMAETKKGDNYDCELYVAPPWFKEALKADNFVYGNAVRRKQCILILLISLQFKQGEAVSDLYVSTAGTNKDRIAAMKGVGEGKRLVRSTALTTYTNQYPNISVREEFNRDDYDGFRPSEALPRNPKDSMRVCDQAYWNIGLVYNVVNLMSDFGSKGAAPAHEAVVWDKLFKEWWKLVEGPIVSERFLNYFFRKGNVIVKRQTAKLSTAELEKLHKGVAAADIEPAQLPKAEKGVIPYKYDFLDPNAVEVIGDPAEVLYSGKIEYGIRVPFGVKRKDKSKVSSVGYNADLEPLDMSKIRHFHYKKDDWQLWAYPMIHPILDNLGMIEKLRLADLAALDGAISHIRVWQLGDLEAKIFPKQAAMDRLAELLMGGHGGATLDLIWGPDLKLTETNTEAYKFLGFDKYVPHMNAIYEGLGIPPSLTGSQSASGMTNNHVSLRTLIERLSYGRMMLAAFWNYEFKLFQMAVQASKNAYLVFDRINIADDSSEKALLIQLLDRNVLSDEAVQKAYGEIPELERTRIKREEKARGSKKKPRKSGPFKYDVDDELTTKQMELQAQAKKAATKGQPQKGRPINSKDKEKRKKKVVKPITGKASLLLMFGKLAQDKIADVVNPIYLKMCGRANMRQLTEEESESLEKLKFGLLLNTIPFAKDSLTADNIKAAIKADWDVNVAAMNLYEKLSEKMLASNGCITIENKRQLQVIVYASINGEENAEVQY